MNVFIVHEGFQRLKHKKKLNRFMSAYLVINQKMFHVSISLSVGMLDHKLTPAMLHLEAKTEGKT